MDIRKLEAFCKVYELRSFSKAGKELFLSQPTISSHISFLEDELDVLLFDRLGRRIVPTQAAEILYTSASRVFENLERVQTEILLLRDKVIGDLNVGGSTIPANHMMPRLMAAFCQMHPDVRFSLTVGDSAQVLNKVYNGDLIMGLVGRKPDLPGLASSLILQDDMVVVAPVQFNNHLNGFKGPWKIADLEQLPWVMREKGSGTRKAFEEAVQGKLSLQELNVRAWVDSTSAALECVLAGVGVSTTSRFVAQPYIDRGQLVVLDVQDLVWKREFYLTYHSERDLFPAVRAFLNFCERRAGDIFLNGTGS
ncbi:selenium metabolism-associated LysR family transcriptional regulator [Salidesulfovibrio onnuriiensis]|uniref:selenium metabolism-associated LysR family transcriptional regulator n=1 Tax=Salidesulfovibrio onnuriiensis TaxID=2583823 RepID=UPI0011CC2658|nr:selenium metabolism-associated LysR family transcriptional regulator [Salidesulfovibrio onnuriiensis]